ncbi:hypothetical protein [Shewanella sp. UCD-KL21]|uniref:hypothetical protein n=1 Tax=Shewanella sp. UCD-KL21 TaxID=1917164 RepID=UPI000970D37C|nr:hypothetical protein [Shewanella sp. UCD-KL21]
MSSNPIANKQSIIIILSLLLATVSALTYITKSNQSHSPETWTSFVYKNGYESASYLMQDGFNDYASCKIYSQDMSATYSSAPWQCGLNCRFDSMRQGFECESMIND